MRTALALLAAGLSAPLAPAQDRATAIYDVRFDATWSAATHPGAYPSGAHFSPLIGATHDDRVHLWEDGGIATGGIEVMAEVGATGTLSSEVQALIATGNAGVVISGGGTGSPGVVDASFFVTDAHPLVTLVTMVAPSPDWFVGTESLPLLENGLWSEPVFELFTYDAGTDWGTDFLSPNQDTTPHEPIALQTGGPFFGDVALGTFTFERRTSTALYGCGLNPAGSLWVSGLPTLGASVTVTIDDPIGNLSLPAATFFVVSTDPDPAFPCGRIVPGFGLSMPGADGELLLAPPFRRIPGPAFTGAPVDHVLPIPANPALESTTLYVQGFFVDTTGRVGATEAVELFLGP